MAPGRRGVRPDRADAELLGPGLAVRRRRARARDVPAPLDYLVGTYGTEGVDEYRARVDEVAVLTAETPPVRPVFEAGDAAVFDQFLLHQTAASPDFREQRYGFESWFFAPSTYPDPNRWIPLGVLTELAGSRVLVAVVALAVLPRRGWKAAASHTVPWGVLYVVWALAGTSLLPEPSARDD